MNVVLNESCEHLVSDWFQFILQHIHFICPIIKHIGTLGYSSAVSLEYLPITFTIIIQYLIILLLYHPVFSVLVYKNIGSLQSFLRFPLKNVGHSFLCFPLKNMRGHSFTYHILEKKIYTFNTMC